MAFALRVIHLRRTLSCAEGKIIGSQLLRASTSVAANYRASRWARSRKEFAARLGAVIEEADESLFWLELLLEANVGPPELIAALGREARQLRAIFVASRKTVMRRGKGSG